MFVVEMPIFSMKPQPAPAKRQVQAKRGQCRPRKKLRREDLVCW